MSTSATVSVTFDSGSEQYDIPALPSLNDPASGTIVVLSNTPYGVDIVGCLFGADSVLIFDGYGMPDSDGTVTIRAGGATRVVAVDADTGEASMQ